MILYKREWIIPHWSKDSPRWCPSRFGSTESKILAPPANDAQTHLIKWIKHQERWAWGESKRSFTGQRRRWRELPSVNKVREPEARVSTELNLQSKWRGFWRGCGGRVMPGGSGLSTSSGWTPPILRLWSATAKGGRGRRLLHWSSSGWLQHAHTPECSKEQQPHDLKGVAEIDGDLEK